MIYLFISICSNVTFFILFKAYPLFKVDAMKAIIINYIVAASLALAFSGNNTNIDFSWSWMTISIVLGIIFIIGYFVISRSTELAGITPTSIASKISMVMPVCFSLLIFKYHDRPFNAWNYIGLTMSIIAIVLSSVKREQHKSIKFDNKIILPFLVFLTGGIIDSIINYVSYQFTNIIDTRVFLAITLGCSGIIGAIYWITKGLTPDLRSLVGGTLLGGANFTALYFVMKALDYYGNNGAMLFPVQNMAIIIISSLVALVFFKEKLNTLNALGLIMALLSIFLISYQAIIF